MENLKRKRYKLPILATWSADTQSILDKFHIIFWWVLIRIFHWIAKINLIILKTNLIRYLKWTQRSFFMSETWANGVVINYWSILHQYLLDLNLKHPIMRAPQIKCPIKSGLFICGFFCPFVDRNKIKNIYLYVRSAYMAGLLFNNWISDLCGCLDRYLIFL